MPIISLARELFHVTYSNIVRIFLRSKIRITQHSRNLILQFSNRFPFCCIQSIRCYLTSICKWAYFTLLRFHLHGKLFSKILGTKRETLPFSVPSEGPGHVEYKIVSPDSVYIEWSEISEEHHNGELLGFYISQHAQCSDDERWSTNVGLFQRSYIITGLHPGTRYDIWIAGFTGRGVGEQRHMDVVMREYWLNYTT